jgi:hypothetical protein
MKREAAGDDSSGERPEDALRGRRDIPRKAQPLANQTLV